MSNQQWVCPICARSIMKKGEKDKKKEWARPEYQSLKFSQTLYGNKPKWSESVTHGPHVGGSMGS